MKEEWYLDWTYREHKDAFLGKVRSRSRWSTAGSIEDPYLRTELGENGDDEEQVIEAEVEGLGSHKWTARQVWTFKEGRFIRRVVTTKTGTGTTTTAATERAESLLVYDYKSPLSQSNSQQASPRPDVQA